MKTFTILVLTLLAIAVITYISSKAKNEVDGKQTAEQEVTEAQLSGSGTPDKANEQKIPTH